METTTTRNVPETGTLEAHPGISVLRELIWSGASATIVAQQDRHKLALYLRQGSPAGAKSNMPSHTLVRLAHRYNLISDQQLQAVVAALNEGSNRMQGELMREQGLDDQRLAQLLRRQTAARFATLLQWQHGRFRVKSELPADVPGEPCGIIDAFFEFSRERWTPGTLLQTAASMTALVVALPDDLPGHLRKELAAHPLAGAWIERLSESPTPLVELAGKPARETARKWLLVDALRTLNALETVDATRPATAKTNVPPGQKPAATAATASPPAPPAKKPSSAESTPAQQADTAVADGVRPDERQANPELDALYEQMREQNWFEILGLERDATARDVKKAYFRLAKQYHPDRYFDPETRRPSHSAEKIFALLNQAYETLRDDEKRRQYLDYLERGTTEEEEMRRAEAILTSEVEFQKAEVLIRLKKYGDAIPHLEQAIELHDEAEYQVLLAWARFMHAWPDDKAACETALLKMKDLLERTSSVNTADAWYLYGRMQKIAGNVSGAKRAFEQALKRDKSHKEAQRELRVLGG